MIRGALSCSIAAPFSPLTSELPFDLLLPWLLGGEAERGPDFGGGAWRAGREDEATVLVCNALTPVAEAPVFMLDGRVLPQAMTSCLQKA